MLLDHFHSPLKDIRPWTGFHGMWAGKLAAAISQRLPDGWFAAPTVHWNVKIDVAAFDEGRPVQLAGQVETSLVIPEPTQTIDFALATDAVEVQVFHDMGELMLVGAIELVSPANKDRAENREAFTAKCDALLRSQVGLAIVDIVTNRRANLHRELMNRLGGSSQDRSHLYLAAYRPLKTPSGSTLNIWYRPLQVGTKNPSTLLFLKQGPIVELPLSKTYQETCADLKIEPPGEKD